MIKPDFCHVNLNYKEETVLNSLCVQLTSVLELGHQLGYLSIRRMRKTANSRTNSRSECGVSPCLCFRPRSHNFQLFSLLSTISTTKTAFKTLDPVAFTDKI